MRGRSVLIGAGSFIVVLGAALLALSRPAPPAALDAPARDAPEAPGAEPVDTAPPAPARTTAPGQAAAAPTAPEAALEAARPPLDEGAPNGAAGDVAAEELGDAAASDVVDTLIAALRSSNDFVVVDAADELVARKATEALPTLERFDVTGRPHAAPSVIDALGRLAGDADPRARRTATDRLLALLAEERTRGARESAGNVLALYEALGRTGDPRAAAALEREALDPGVSFAAKTVIVEALVRLRQPTSAPILRRLLAMLADAEASDELEEETRRELATAIDRALRALP